MEVMSDSVSETFYTRPLPATGFHLVDGGQGWKIAWMPSLTPYVTHYKIKWVAIEEAMTIFSSFEAFFWGVSLFHI